MAVGDKKPVVMEEDMAVPGGIATLGTDGKLSSEQIPDLEALGAIEYINSLPFTRKNLLDNWYFADPIDQRGGYVAPPGIAYYENVGDTTHIGLTGTYYTAKSDSSGNYAITVNGATYYVSPSNVVRGYTGNGYTIDRWTNLGATIPVILRNDGVTIDREGQLFQFIEPIKMVNGGMYTASCILDGELYKVTFRYDETETDGTVHYVACGGKANLVFYKNPFSSGNNAVGVNLIQQTIKISAIKLELGSTQTLARQDENGNCVLNEIPNYAEELAKCQMYYQLFSSADTRPENLADYRPTMRANPALGTININGQTMYFADANL